MPPKNQEIPFLIWLLRYSVSPTTVRLMPSTVASTVRIPSIMLVMPNRVTRPHYAGTSTAPGSSGKGEYTRLRSKTELWIRLRCYYSGVSTCSRIRIYIYIYIFHSGGCEQYIRDDFKQCTCLHRFKNQFHRRLDGPIYVASFPRAGLLKRIAARTATQESCCVTILVFVGIVNAGERAPYCVQANSLLSLCSEPTTMKIVLTVTLEAPRTQTQDSRYI